MSATKINNLVDIKPIWVRPKVAVQLYGIGRTHLYKLMTDKKIKNVSLAEQGQKHGTRLISCESLENYINSFAEGGNQ